MKKEIPYEDFEFDDMPNDDDYDLNKIPEENNKKDKAYQDNYFGDDFGYSDYGSGINVADKYNDLLKSLTNFDPYLKNLISELLGMYFDYEEEKYKRSPQSQPIVNYEGARRIIMFLRIYARENNMLVHLEKETSKDFQEDIYNFTHFVIGANMEDFGIKSDKDLVLVMRIIEHSASLILESAWGNKTAMDFMGNSASFNQSINVKPEPEKKKENILTKYISKANPGGD